MWYSSDDKGPALKHVYMLIGNTWRHITAQDVADMNPGDMVSERSEIFKCDLCGKSVRWVRGDKVQPYFRHEDNISKDCPDYTGEADSRGFYDAQKHDLPIRLDTTYLPHLRFQIGFVRIPDHLFAKDFLIKISLEWSGKKISSTPIEYDKLHFTKNRITYLPISRKPFEKCLITVLGETEDFYTFWPEETNGINPKGTLFHKDSGKKLLVNEDVEIEKEYYLLKKGDPCQNINGIKVTIIEKYPFYGKEWTLSMVSAKEITSESIQYFLNLRYNLTDSPISLMPVWPLFLEDDYVVKHNQEKIYMLIRGNIYALKTFPPPREQELIKTRNPYILKKILLPGKRQQLISIGRGQPLQYTYFWKEALNKESKCPKVEALDINKKIIRSGKSNKLPLNGVIIVKSPFDASVVFLKGERITHKQKITGGKKYKLENLDLGIKVQILIGRDVAWEVEFTKSQAKSDKHDADVLKWIRGGSGITIAAPHSLRNIYSNMGDYPEICKWIQTCLKTGSIQEQAYRRLQYFYINKKIKE
jgi:hypothetical protein